MIMTDEEFLKKKKMMMGGYKLVDWLMTIFFFGALLIFLSALWFFAKGDLWLSLRIIVVSIFIILLAGLFKSVRKSISQDIYELRLKHKKDE